MAAEVDDAELAVERARPERREVGAGCAQDRESDSDQARVRLTERPEVADVNTSIVYEHLRQAVLEPFEDNQPDR